MIKNIFAVILIFIMILSTSCADTSDSIGSDAGGILTNADVPNDTSSSTPITVKKEKIVLADHKNSDQLITAGEDKYAVRFTAESKLHSFDLHAFSSGGMCSAKIALYKWSNDYETTVNAQPYDTYTLSPLSKKEIGAIQAMSFPSTKTPPAGEYLIVISLSNSGGVILMGDKTDDAKENGVVCYKNGVEYDKTPCMTMTFQSK